MIHSVFGLIVMGHLRGICNNLVFFFCVFGLIVMGHLRGLCNNLVFFFCVGIAVRCFTENVSHSKCMFRGTWSRFSNSPPIVSCPLASVRADS
ncbi:hypothetical protein CSKR_204105 [Clonorchis sinensis]|uniref:Uncharacterized protein n=1 Tax=Clonorchis sinensis TaxID=79923 RepID=A0A8T1MBL0_CLOSI|nr:hypothetical protein CSKR_204105 [Clonorchis sinensis]